MDQRNRELSIVQPSSLVSPPSTVCFYSLQHKYLPQFTSTPRWPRRQAPLVSSEFTGLKNRGETARCHGVDRLSSRSRTLLCAPSPPRFSGPSRRSQFSTRNECDELIVKLDSRHRYCSQCCVKSVFYRKRQYVEVGPLSARDVMA